MHFYMTNSKQSVNISYGTYLYDFGKLRDSYHAMYQTSQRAATEEIACQIYMNICIRQLQGNRGGGGGGGSVCKGQSMVCQSIAFPYG